MTTTPRRQAGLGTILVGIVLVALGGYYLLRNAFGIELPELDSEVVVPLLALLAGGALIYRWWRDHQVPAGPAI